MTNETWFLIVTWACAVVSVAGVILNIKKKRACFYLWACTNATWTVVDFYEGIYAQSVLFFLYFLLALWGLWEWKVKN